MQSDVAKKMPGAQAGQGRIPPELRRAGLSLCAPAASFSASFPPAAAAGKLADLRRRLTDVGVDLRRDGDAYLVVTADGTTARLLSLAAVEPRRTRRLRA